jgi:hypothetical protein
MDNVSIFYPFGIFYGHTGIIFYSQFIKFVAIWYIPPPALVCFTKKNLASLLASIVMVYENDQACLPQADTKTDSGNWW